MIVNKFYCSATDFSFYFVTHHSMFDKGLINLYVYNTKCYVFNSLRDTFTQCTLLKKVFVYLRDSFNSMWQIILMKQSEIDILRARLNIFKMVLVS